MSSSSAESPRSTSFLAVKTSLAPMLGHFCIWSLARFDGKLVVVEQGASLTLSVLLALYGL